ncbi:unnamed protein product [[Actinomadura] parvosata subsp. kistnae]|uniref:Secreted protein n=1 Tax=[Actinomadura] parvosata subsp. kistnae TaxID=1909395 RepID=A0A1V0A864_9ACTN|nr:hypothetical protein [Nonomuraea sp. ATCC 55076]AQZ66401.1 hypothetical protein BKM31_37575 [Nonomuraea sp. ATCC 55076]SPL95554.1 unnamed protein product [Actinomadura parvosata subsp. kistnae]
MAFNVRRPAQVLLLVLALTLTAGAALCTPAAFAATLRSATSTGWGPSPDAGRAAAEGNARAALNQQAAAAGEVCSGVSVTTRHLYTAPDGSAWIYEATATGDCAVPPTTPPPSYTVPRTETRQGGGASPNAAVENGSQAARAALLAAGQACTGYSTTSSLVYSAPGGAWWIYNVTVSATCTH